MHWFVAEHGWLGRLLFERSLAAVYAVAFMVAANQYKALLGDHGLMPVRRFLARTSFRRHPSLFHWHHSDRFFQAVAWAGAALSVAVVAGLADAVPLPAAMVIWLVLWWLYQSIVNVGQRWYSFGWESLLVETGFLAIFLGNASTPPPLLTLLLLRWLLFRLEFGAGLIKMRGDRSWRDLTALYYHHETQPMPGPLSWFFHHLPKPLHRVEVAANHVTQLVVPFGLFAPQPYAGIAAAIMILTQLWLVASGNFAWLNWLAIVLGFSVLPDDWLRPLLGSVGHPGAPVMWFVVVVVAATAAMVVMSWWPVRNMLGRSQLMNASFNAWHLVNTYGAFGSVSQIRYEVVVEGTRDAHPDESADWREYEFKGKPGDISRLPRQFAPYHLRLDWLMWFAALSPAYAEPWFSVLLQRLLEGDRAVSRLLRHDPFGDEPPRYVRALLYRYRFTSRTERRETGAWWSRRLVGDFARPVSRSSWGDLARRG